MRQGNNETGLYFPLMRQGSIFQSLSLAGQTIDSLNREATPPYLPSFFSLPPFLPILPLHPPSIRWTTNRNVVSGSTVKAKPHTPRSQMLSLRNLFHTERQWCLGTSLRV